MDNKSNKRREFVVNLITAFSVILVLIIFGITVYLVLKREADNEDTDVATLTDAISKTLTGVNYISTEATTEELTTEEQTTEQLTTEEITTETTTESTTEEDTAYEEDYIYCDSSVDSGSDYDYYDNGQEEEVYESEPVEEYYEEPEPENDYIPEDTNAHEGMRYYGTMETTAYEWTDETCADGRYPELGYTAACNDPALWNHWVYIEGVGERYIHDHGDPEVMGNTTVDIYMGDVDTCYQYGRQTCDIYIID